MVTRRSAVLPADMFRQELDRRKKEPTKRCYSIKIKSVLVSSHGSVDFFKKFEDAKSELFEHLDDVECGNCSLKIEPVDISASDYDLRPDCWYG